jgi:hypothetical protein
MTIKDSLFTMSKDIITSLGLQFEDYLKDNVTVTFKDKYPDKNESLIRIETLKPTLEINGQHFDIWSEDFQKLSENNDPRKYQISLSFGHQFCFNALYNYFEILAFAQPTNEAQIKFDEFHFYLEVLLKHNNKKFRQDYIRYWREFLQRLKSMFVTGETSFPNRFHTNEYPKIILNIDETLKILPPMIF